jgi:ATP-binding cassette subfamily B protein
MLSKLLRTQLAPYKGTLLAICFFQLVQTLAALALPSINADIINKGVVLGDTGYIWSRGGVMLAVSAVQITFNIVAVYFGARAAATFGRDVRKALFHRVTSFSTQDVAEFGAPSLITRITNDVLQVQTLVVMTATLAVAAPIMMIGGVVMALREDVGLSTILVVAVPVLAGAVGLIVVRMVPRFRVMQDQIDSLNQLLREQITGIRVIRAFVRERQEEHRFELANDELTHTSLKAGRLIAMMFPTIIIVLNISSIAAVWVGAHRIESGAIQIGALIAFLTYLVQILMAVMMGSFVAIMVPRAAVCADRIQEVLDRQPSIAAPAEPTDWVQGERSLEFQNVDFVYPGAQEPVLCGVSFRVEAGQTLAIIGSTGSGKTTLLNLIPRLMEVSAGSVLVNGVDVREVAPERLWSRIGLIPQKPFLFSGTVASNLRFANPDAPEDRLWQALSVAQAADFVAAMPGGLEAPIVQGGANVSGGQRQRLSIARAIVHEPEILIFDDSFSALDLATDARLRTALGPVTNDAIKVIVAQRVSTIAEADQILVLEDGHVMGKGTHNELLLSCETYREIVESQLAEPEVAA